MLSDFIIINIIIILCPKIQPKMLVKSQRFAIKTKYTLTDWCDEFVTSWKKRWISPEYVSVQIIYGYGWTCTCVYSNSSAQITNKIKSRRRICFFYFTDSCLFNFIIPLFFLNVNVHLFAIIASHQKYLNSGDVESSSQ